MTGPGMPPSRPHPASASWQQLYQQPSRQPGPAYPPPPRFRWHQVPALFWAALIVGAAGFTLRVSYTTQTVDSSGYRCSDHNYGGLVVAAVMLVLVVVGWARRPTLHPNARLSVPLMTLATAALLALTVVHVVRGTTTFHGNCAAPS